MRILVLGKTQSGKTYYVYNELYKKITNHYRIFIDPKPSSYVVPVTKDGIIIHSINDLKYFKKLHDNKEVILKGKLSLKYNFEDEAELLFTEIIKNVGSGKYKSNVFIVVDEIHRFGSKHSYMDVLGKIIKEGEAHGISTVLISQHPCEISNVLILNCEMALLFGNNPILKNYYAERLSLDITPYDEWLNQDYHGICYDWKNVELIVSE